MNKDDKVFIVKYRRVVIGATYISKGPQWNYVLFDDGTVQGFTDATVFPTKEEAQAELIKILTNDLAANAIKVLDRLIALDTKEVKK